MKKIIFYSMIFLAMLLFVDVVIARSVAEPDTASAIMQQQNTNDDNLVSFDVNGVQFNMVKVDRGTFVMGCTPEQNECEDDEKLSHQVTITYDYYIGQTEVTQELYYAVTGENPSNFKGGRLPVESVSWMDAQDFCLELSRLTGRRFSLPTEAEWEYAARGGNQSIGAPYSGGYGLNKVAWYDENSSNQTHPVGQLRPNELGIYDMSGNVWEWCQDWYGSYDGGNQTNPKGPLTGSRRVLRGGSWGSIAGGCRVSIRGFSTPGGRNSHDGFRVVLR